MYVHFGNLAHLFELKRFKGDPNGHQVTSLPKHVLGKEKVVTPMTLL
jgi:hypothetical protein